MRMRIRRPILGSLVMALAATAPIAAWPQAGESTAPPQNSALDSPLFYQLLIGELELRQGQPGNAFEILLDAARRTRDDALYRRAVDIALHARAGDQALQATRAWRQALPRSTDALRAQLQLLAAMNRNPEMAEPMRALLQLTPEAERGALISVMPRFLQRSSDRRQAAQLIDAVLEPYRQAHSTRVPALVASARTWALAEDYDAALDRIAQASATEPGAPGPALLAVELLPKRANAEPLVRAYLDQPQSDAAVRLSYVRALMGQQRFVDAASQLERVTRDKPELAQPFLTLGALQLEMRHPEQAEVALKRYLELATADSGPARSSAADDDEGDDRPDQGAVQAWMMLAQAAELRGDFAAAESWLARIDDPRRALEVQTRRATLLARQGRVAEAREAVRRAPEREDGDARAKLVAEAGVLREVKRWSEAFELLGSAAERFPDDPDLLYEQAMMAEKLERMDEMERLLRRVISIKPDNAHAHNALGYSLADRAQRLPEARDLIQRALELSPGDPFITDSLGWVEFRLGRHDEALRLLRQAYAARPDVEIGAHLGEVLWAMGRREEARQIWSESRRRDAANDVLRETLARLKVEL